MTLLADPQARLATSASVDRKAWAEAIVNGCVPMLTLIELFDSDATTNAQPIKSASPLRSSCVEATLTTKPPPLRA